MISEKAIAAIPIPLMLDQELEIEDRETHEMRKFKFGDEHLFAILVPAWVLREIKKGSIHE